MAIQNKYESEKSKRKLAAAEDYLAKRDAFLTTKKPGYTVDMTGEDTSKMSDAQIKDEGDRRIGDAKTNFQNSFSAARREGFSSDPTLEAQAYLSSAASPRIMEDIGDGAKADTATANRILSYRELQNTPVESSNPDWKKARASMEARKNEAKTRNEESGDRYKSFVDGLNQEKSLKQQATQDIALAKRENYNARLVERATRTALQRYIATNGRRGSLVTSEQMDAATKRVARSEMGLGTTNDVDARYKTAYARVAKGVRYNPYEPAQVAQSTDGQNRPVVSKSASETDAPVATSSSNQRRRRSSFTSPYLNLAVV